MENNLISIIVPIYNVEKYLNKCIDSILNQTYKNIEVILIDDGSTDRSKELCDDFLKIDKRIKVIHKENGGLSEARNVGIQNSTGKYICFIDSDDYVSTEYVEKLYNAIIREQADIAACDFWFTDENGNKWEQKINKYDSNYTNIEALKDMLSCKQIIEVMTWNKLYKRSLFIDNEIKFPKGKLHEDNFTTYKLFYYSQKITLIKDKLYYYLQRKDSLMGKKFNENRLDILQCLNETKEFLNAQKCIELNQYYKVYSILTKCNLINNMIIDKYDINMIQSLRKEVKNEFGEIKFSKILKIKSKISITLLILNLNIYKKIILNYIYLINLK